MTQRFKIVDMKKANGHWTVKFDSVPNEANFGAPTVTVDIEEFRSPEVGMHEFTPQEVIDMAHRAVANSLYSLFKTSVISLPNVDWESVRNLTVSEILGALGLDDGA